MSSSPTTVGTQQGGLGRSTPLVTVSNVHSGIRTSTSERMAPVSAGTDHPLSNENDRPLASVELSPQVTPSPTPPVTSPPAPAVTSPPPKFTSPIATVTAPTVVHLPQPAVNKPPSTSLDDMADEFLSQSSARTEAGLPPLLKPMPLPKDESGITRLRTLVARRAWGDVLQVSNDMLRGTASPYTLLYASLVNNGIQDGEELHQTLKEETIEILTLECHAWLQLRRYAELGREIDRWNFLSHNDSDAKSPSWVPWSLHILAAESLQYTNPSSNRCTDELYSLRRVLEEKKQTAWLPSVNNALANAFLRRNEWRLALHALDNIIISLPDATRAFYPEEHIDNLSGAFKCEVLSRQGRIMLQIGALLEASTLFELVKKEWQTPNTSHSSHWIFRKIPSQIRINDGLLCFAHAQYEQAITHYRKAMDLERSLSKSFGYTKEPLLLADAHQLSHCCNNISLCALYTCRLQDAVRMMESVIREDPTQFLTERLAFNLCTLYELGSDAAASARKKRLLQVIAKRFYLHDIGPESFRVSP